MQVQLSGEAVNGLENTLCLQLYSTVSVAYLGLYIFVSVLSSSLKWIPLGNQTDIFQESSMQPLHDDILLAKMNCGHLINLEVYAVKGEFQEYDLVLLQLKFYLFV